jgi:hypothetical protein
MARKNKTTGERVKKRGKNEYWQRISLNARTQESINFWAISHHPSIFFLGKQHRMHGVDAMNLTPSFCLSDRTKKKGQD